MLRISRARKSAVTTAVVSLAAAVIAAPAASAAGPGRELNLKFENSSLRSNAGNAGLAVDVVTHNGGEISETSRNQGTAVRLPAYRASNPPFAAFRVRDYQGADDLSPENAKFRFGADFTLDSRSQGSSVDNGNNLVQRGLYNAPLQYKIELDNQRPACRVKGAGGAVTVRSSHRVQPDHWYRATCTRDGSKVTLQVLRLGDGTRWTSTASGRTGYMKAPSGSLPLSVGSKLNRHGQIARNSADQFNGRVDNVFLNIF